mgnify:CR=1 FL=1
MSRKIEVNTNEFHLSRGNHRMFYNSYNIDGLQDDEDLSDCSNRQFGIINDYCLYKMVYPGLFIARTINQEESIDRRKNPYAYENTIETGG